MRQPIRVALSGSGFLLPAHVGAVTALLVAGYDLVELAGTSGGSIVATLVAMRMDLQEMRTLALTTDWAKLMPFSLGNTLRRRSLSTGKPLQDFLWRLTREHTFSGLDIGLKVIASNLATKRPFIFSQETTPAALLAHAMRASAAIPLIYEPVIVGDAILFDGGMIDNFPGDALVHDDVPRIGVDLVDDDVVMKPEDYSLRKAIPRMLEILLGTSEAMQISNSEATGTKMVRVPTGFASSLDRHMPRSTREALFDAGYEATKAVL